MYSTVQFRTQLQATAVVRSLQRQEFLYIAPCGVGKSLCFWLPMLREKCTTVLFLPYALLRRNVHLQAETMGISSVLFEKTVIVNFESPPRLLICAVEQIRTMSHVLTQLARKNLLARIIIDEIQCVFTEEFRNVMGDFRVWRAQLAFGT
jgi:superfamily II DNA helicase RecQ